MYAIQRTPASASEAREVDARTLAASLAASSAPRDALKFRDAPASPSRPRKTVQTTETERAPDDTVHWIEMITRR